MSHLVNEHHRPGSCTITPNEQLLLQSGSVTVELVPLYSSVP